MFNLRSDCRTADVWGREQLLLWSLLLTHSYTEITAVNNSCYFSQKNLLLVLDMTLTFNPDQRQSSEA